MLRRLRRALQFTCARRAAYQYLARLFVCVCQLLSLRGCRQRAKYPPRPYCCRHRSLNVSCLCCNVAWQLCTRFVLQVRGWQRACVICTRTLIVWCRDSGPLRINASDLMQAYEDRLKGVEPAAGAAKAPMPAPVAPPLQQTAARAVGGGGGPGNIWNAQPQPAASAWGGAVGGGRGGGRRQFWWRCSWQRGRR